MECRVCDKNDARRRFYCSNCVTNRIGEHHVRRQQLAALVQAVTSKSIDLLTPPQASAVLGVQEERLLKAEKWKLANRLRDTRNAIEKGRMDLDTDKIKVAERRTAVSKRRNNLINARTLSIPEKGDTEASNSNYTALLRDHHKVLLAIEETRQILIRELLFIYHFTPNDRPLASPFKSPSSPSSSTSSTSSLYTELPSHNLATLPLPTLHSIPVMPSILLSATLSNLLHLSRLLALYYGIALPFTPIPNLFDPGRAGVRASPRWGESSYPVFGSRSASSSRSDSKLEELTLVHGAGQQSGGREDDLAIKEAKRKEDRMKAVVGGAVALGFNLAYMAWRRGREVSIGEIADLGSLVQKAVESSVGSGSAVVRNRITTIPTMRLPSAVFPIEFSALMSIYATPSSLKLLRAAGPQIDGGEGAEEGWDLV